MQLNASQCKSMQVNASQCKSMQVYASLCKLWYIIVLIYNHSFNALLLIGFIYLFILYRVMSHCMWPIGQ